MSTPPVDNGYEQPRQYQQSNFNHSITDEIEQIESRLIARATKFLLLNAAAFIGAITTGVAAYYSLERRASTVELRIDINSARIERLINEDASIRSEIRDNQNTLIQQNNSLSNYLKEHDRNMQKNQR